jgi:tetratricopeptide (TPR) repeat protein
MAFIDLSDSPISNLNDYNEETEDEDIILEIGKPFEFKKDESYSFNQWLQLTKIKPIDRADKKNYSKDKREKNIETINKFIEKNPKISPLKSKEPIIDLSETNSIEPESLMTETLARIYLEQKNYAKAIQSYKILILKYPEKSALFADQIKAVEKLQEKIKKS